MGIPALDMFWSEPCGTVFDRDGYTWMIRMRKAEPTTNARQTAMEKMMEQQATSALVPPRVYSF